MICFRCTRLNRRAHSRPLAANHASGPLKSVSVSPRELVRSSRIQPAGGSGPGPRDTRARSAEARRICVLVQHVPAASTNLLDRRRCAERFENKPTDSVLNTPKAIKTHRTPNAAIRADPLSTLFSLLCSKQTGV